MATLNSTTSPTPLIPTQVSVLDFFVPGSTRILAAIEPVVTSLISSAQDKLLNEFPTGVRNNTTDSEIQGDPNNILPLIQGRMMFWVWQTPMMLMSYGVALFLVGYFVLILAPFFDGTHVDLNRLLCPGLLSNQPLTHHTNRSNYVLDSWYHCWGWIPYFP
jgi:hypothetical protein